MLENCRPFKILLAESSAVRKNLSWLPVKDQLYYGQAIMAFNWMTGNVMSNLANEQLGVATS